MRTRKRPNPTRAWICDLFTRSSLALTGCLALHTVFAALPDTPPPGSLNPMVPMTPGASVSGAFIGLNSGWGDAMVPVLRTPSSGFLFIDPQALYHNGNQYSGSLGLGLRQLTEHTGILGAYVFGDYNHSLQNKSFWFVSPGVERLGDTLDLSVNGYFPVSQERVNTTAGFASTFGNFNHVVFTGHTELDNVVQNFESIGPGVDGEVGVRLPFLRNNTKLYLGGYYFGPKDNPSITGGIANLNVPVTNRWSVNVSDAYDNVFHNTFKVGISLAIGGRTTHCYDHSVENRLVDPIQRNRVASEGSSGTAQYIADGTQVLGQGVVASNISFFVPGTGSLADANAGPVGAGTYENPYQGMLQDNVTDANTKNNRLFYINSGTYSAQYDAAVNPNLIVLNNDQLFGRTNDFKQPAQGNARPIMTFANDGFEVPIEDSYDSINALQLVGGGSGVGVFINHDLHTDLIAPDLTADLTNLSVSNFGDGINILNGDSAAGTSGAGTPGVGNATVNITDSTVNNNTGVAGALQFPGFSGIGGVAGGIAGANLGDRLTINVTNVSASNNHLDQTDNVGNPVAVGVAGGIAVYNFSSTLLGTTGQLFLNVNQSIAANNIANNPNISSGIGYAAGGIAGESFGNTMTVNINNVQAVNNMINSAFSDTSAGIAAETDAGNLTLNVINSLVSGNSGAGIFGGSGGISTANYGNANNLMLIHIVNSTISENRGNSAGGGDEGGGITNDTNGNSASTTTVLNIIHSIIFSNMGIADHSGGNMSGGIAAGNYEGQLIVQVMNSQISGNMGSGTDMNAGIVVGNGNISNVETTVSVIGSTIVNNTASSPTTGGGIAVENFASGSSLTLNVDTSVLYGNQGVGFLANNAAGSSLTATIDHSQLYGNTVGIHANNSTVTITNPIFFDGVVTVNGGTVTFPGLSFSSGTHTVVCPLDSGVCVAS